MGLEDAIRCGGLAATKAARIRAMLRGVREKRGAICLEYLRELSVDEVKRELSQFKGIGPKTVSYHISFLLFHCNELSVLVVGGLRSSTQFHDKVRRQCFWFVVKDEN